MINKILKYINKKNEYVNIHDLKNINKTNEYVNVHDLKNIVEKRNSSSNLPLQLSDKHIKNCRLKVDRNFLLEEMPKNAHCAEVGVLFGLFSTQIVSITQPKKLHLFDNNLEFLNHSVEQIHKIDKTIDLQTHFGDSSQTLNNLAPQSLDWIYLDADHSYDAVWAELLHAHRIIKKGGYIVLNDYIFYDHINLNYYGVIQAANKFCIEYNYEILFFALSPQMFCDIAIRKIPD